jgi:hypothetical protein
MREFEVIIPVRNGGQALRNSIQSVLACANSSRILLTLSDNFSTDGLPWKDMLTDFPQEQWRIISPPQSLGRVEHWSWAFQQAQLPWVKPLMVGDRIENGFWDWVGTAIEQFPRAGIFFSDSYTIDPVSAHPKANGSPSMEKSDTVLYDYEEFTRDTIRGINHIGALSKALLRADVMRMGLPFEPEYPWTADLRFCRRCLQQAPAVQTDAPLVCLDRSIARLSTSWKGLRGSFLEEWKFAAEQAALTKAPRLKAFFLRGKAVGAKMIFVIGRRILPRPVRAFLTTASGLHRPSPKSS